MKVLAIALISLLSLCAIILLILYIKSRRPFRAAGINMLLGLAALALVNLTARFTGVYIPMNIYSVPGSMIFGLPAVCALVILQNIML